MIRTIKYTIWCLMLLACQSIDKAPEPKVLIGEDLMVEILTDIAFVKAAKSSNRKVFEQKKINPEIYILNKYNIDSIVFSENNIWYADQLEKYEEIFKRVKDNLEKSRDAFEKLKKEEDSIKKVEDSIRKSKDTLQNKDELLIPLELKAVEEDIEQAKLKRFKPRSKKQ